MATRFASSRMARCLLTACRVIARRTQSSPSVWPLSARSRSSSSRRLASASALNTSSMSTICNHSVACQARKNAAAKINRGGRTRPIGRRLLVEALPNELLLVDRIIAEALLQRISLNGAVHTITEGGDRRRLVGLRDGLGQRRSRRAVHRIRRRAGRRNVGAAAARDLHRAVGTLHRLLGLVELLVPRYAGRAVALHDDRRAVAVHREELARSVPEPIFARRGLRLGADLFLSGRGSIERAQHHQGRERE